MPDGNSIGIAPQNNARQECHLRGIDPKRGESVDRVVRAVEKRIGEQFGVEPVETTMPAMVCRALR